MTASETLDRAVREAERQIVGALTVRFRDFDIAQEAFADTCAQALESWAQDTPRDPVAWLYRVACRRALDVLRRRRTRDSLLSESLGYEPSPEDLMINGTALIPDERLRLIFVCCHPAIAAESRAALTLHVVCGLSTVEIAHAFLVSEAALAQRLVRAKRKISAAKVPFEVPGPEAWPERLDAVLTTLEIAYSKAHEDAAGAGPHSNYASEMLELTRALADLIPHEPAVLAFAALVRYAEARRPARLNGAGVMVPLSEQDPVLWRRALIEAGDRYLERAGNLPPIGPRFLQAAIHATWCSRRSLAQPPPWREVLALYDTLLSFRDDPIVFLNRAVALAEVQGAEAALLELNKLNQSALEDFLPYHALRADLLRRTGFAAEARAAYNAALALDPTSAERLWLEQQAHSNF